MMRRVELLLKFPFLLLRILNFLLKLFLKCMVAEICLGDFLTQLLYNTGGGLDALVQRIALFLDGI